MRTRLHLLLAATAAASAVVTSAPAAAQDNVDTRGLADIIVTAQRRAEILQDVPISITVADSAALAEARVENISNIQAISPSVAFRVTNIATSSANLMIRGMGTVGTSRSFEGSVGVFIDGVYRTRAAAALQNFLDIGNLQILRGPQGTLFGKNTTAGAILLSSSAPDPTRFSGDLDLTYGNYSLQAKAAANVPLGDTAALRVAALASRDKGFFTNPTSGERLNDNQAQAVKGQLLWEPTDGFSARLIGDYSKGSGNCCYATSDYIEGWTQPIIDQMILNSGGTVPPHNGISFQQNLNGKGNQVVKDYGGTLLLDIDIGPGTLHSVTGYRKFTVDQRDMDPDFSGADLMRYYESFGSRFVSQELTYTTPVAPLNGDLVLGAFFSDEKLSAGRILANAFDAQPYWDIVLPILVGGPLPPGLLQAPSAVTPAGEVLGGAVELMRGTARSYAAFAHLESHLSDKVSLIAGIRYSIEKKSGSFHYDPASLTNPLSGNLGLLLGTGPGPAYDSRTENKAVSGTLGIQFRPTDEIMFYATYNRGFKAGGVNMDANAAGALANNPVYTPGGVPLSPIYDPEKVNAFEVGAKMQYLDNRARTNISLFYYDISNLQVAQFSGLQFIILNANSAKDYGAEIENLFQLAPGVTLGLDGTWIPHARYGDDPALSEFLRNSRFRFTPKFTGNATLNIDQPLNDNVNLTGRVQYQYRGEQFSTASNLTKTDAVSLVNGNLGLRLPNNGLRIEGWVQNLFNKTYAVYTFSTSLQFGDSNAFLGAPRTFGVRLHADF